jgi:interferon gamma-inducible protein 30
MVCLETAAKSSKEANADWNTWTMQCAMDLNLPNGGADITQCTTSTQGNEWQHDIAVATENLSPAHKWVPWIVVNGVYDDDNADDVMSDMLGFVC